MMKLITTVNSGWRGTPTNHLLSRSSSSGLGAKAREERDLFGPSAARMSPLTILFLVPHEDRPSIDWGFLDAAFLITQILEGETHTTTETHNSHNNGDKRADTQTIGHTRDTVKVSHASRPHREPPPPPS